MNDFFPITFNFIAQFTGGHGDLKHVVNHGIGAVLFGVLLTLAFFQLREENNYRERLLTWGFSIGMGRELFMILSSYVRTIDLLPDGVLFFILPVEHGLSNLAMIVITAAFLRYILNDTPASRHYFTFGIGSTLLCYLIIFVWWISFSDTSSDFYGQYAWCSWLFEINAIIWLLIPLVWLLKRTKGEIRNLVCFALACFFLSELLKTVNMASVHVFQFLLMPVSNGLYMLAIPVFGFVYLKEMYQHRREIISELKQSRITLETIFQNSIPTCITSTDYEVLHANESYIATFGYDLREPGKCYHTRPGTLCHTEQCPMKQILNGKKSLTIDSTKFNKDNEERHYIITAKPFYNPEGKIVGIVESFQDITRRKQMMEEREEMEMMLRQSQKMKALGTMAGGIAHDFNNILFITIGNAELALDTIEEDNPAREKIDQILKISSRGQDLVRQILTFSRRESHVMNPHSLQQLIERILKMIRPTIPATVELKIQLDQDCPPVLSDSTQISQLLLNLCSNAVHAMNESGVLSISLHNIFLGTEELGDQSHMKPGPHVRLTVQDNGLGMSTKVLERIFEPFYTTKEVGTGTGMGLSVVHGIVKGHEARILVESEEGKGATFHIDFPVTEAVKKEIPEREDPITGGKERILFVDDEEALAVMAGMTLEQLGYQVTIRTQGREALDLFQSDPTAFDLVITDQSMPKLSGANLAAKLLEIRPDLPIILCTGYSKKITREKALAMGIREFCLKPLYRKQFAQTVRKVLDEAGKVSKTT